MHLNFAAGYNNKDVSNVTSFTCRFTAKYTALLSRKSRTILVGQVLAQIQSLLQLKLALISHSQPTSITQTGFTANWNTVTD